MPKQYLKFATHLHLPVAAAAAAAAYVWYPAANTVTATAADNNPQHKNNMPNKQRNTTWSSHNCESKGYFS